VSDLKDREELLPAGRECPEVMSQLTRAGYSTEEVLELVGIPEDIEE
jgi:transposase